MGGDGTLLHANSIFQHSVPPILSFHLGEPVGIVEQEEMCHFLFFSLLFFLAFTILIFFFWKFHLLLGILFNLYFSNFAHHSIHIRFSSFNCFSSTIIFTKFCFFPGSLGFLMPFDFSNYRSDINRTMAGDVPLVLRSRLKGVIMKRQTEPTSMMTPTDLPLPSSQQPSQSLPESPTHKKSSTKRAEISRGDGFEETDEDRTDSANDSVFVGTSNWRFNTCNIIIVTTFHWNESNL